MAKFFYLLSAAVNGLKIAEDSFVSSMPLHWTNCICPFVKIWLDEKSQPSFNWDDYVLPEINKYGTLCALNVEKSEITPSDIDDFYGSNEDLIHAMCGNPLPEVENEGWNRNLDHLTYADSVTVDYNALNGYGCFCSAGSNWSYGVGQPVDEVDDRCRKVHLAYKCLKQVDSPACDVENQVYIATSGGNANPLAVCNGIQSFISERLKNENFDEDCAVRKCAIEVSFQQFLLDRAVTPGVSLDAQHVRDDTEYTDKEGNTFQGTFDYKSTCYSETGPGRELEFCCGKYPFRKPFYNSMLQCCDDGTVANVC